MCVLAYNPSCTIQFAVYVAYGTEMVCPTSISVHTEGIFRREPSTEFGWGASGRDHGFSFRS
jgi:hypothetical protein